MSDALKDLAIVPVTSSDTNYFLRKVTGLKIDKTYSFKFQWVFEDDTKSDWSPGYQINTPTEGVPGAPSAIVPATSTGNIPVTLSSFPANTKRVDIYVIGGTTYGTGKVVDSFFAAGTKTISITEPGSYQVVLIAVTPSGINGDPTNAFTITVSASSVDTTVIPGAPTSIVVAGFNEPSDPLNRTGYANVSFVAGSGSKGHSIGLWTSNPGTTDPVRVIPADGTSTKVEGLFVGQSYYFKVRSFNQFNNASAWVAPASNYPVTIPGSILVPGAVTISASGAPKSILVSWSDPSSNASLVTSGGYYEVKLYTNNAATGTGAQAVALGAIETRKAWSNQASFSGLTTGIQYWVTVQPYTAGSAPVAGTTTAVYGPLVPSAIDNPDLKGDFILASNQLQVGGTSGGKDIHLSAYTKTVDLLPTYGRIYIGGPETSGSDAVGLYNNSGTPFYADNYGRFSLGDKLTWSGNLATPALSIKGTIDVTGPSTFSSYVLSGATNSAFIGIGYQVPYRLSNVLQSGASGITGIVINSSGTAANSDYIKSDGTFRLAEGKLTFAGGTLAVQGNITANAIAANTDLQGLDITGTSGTIGGITLNSSGLSATNFSISSTGLITANGGTIGGWTINSTQLRSSAADGSNRSYISLNPATPKIALVTGATFASGVPSGGTEAITIDPIDGIKDSAGNFSLTPAGILTLKGSITTGSTITGATITGGTFTSTGSGFFSSGNLVINSGYISHTTGISLDSPGFYASSTDGYMYLMADGTVIMGQGNATGDLQMRITTNTTSAPYPRGFQLFGLGNSEFRAPSQHVSNSYNFPTVVSGPFGELMTGRTLWYGSSGTSATINAAVGGSLGDIYFSTS